MARGKDESWSVIRVLRTYTWCNLVQGATAMLVAHGGSIAGADFFTTEVWTWQGLATDDTVFIIALAFRGVQVVGSTPPPQPNLAHQCIPREDSSLGPAIHPGELRLAQLFKTTPQFWMHMQANFDLKAARRADRNSRDSYGVADS